MLGFGGFGFCVWLVFVMMQRCFCMCSSFCWHDQGTSETPTCCRTSRDRALWALPYLPRLRACGETSHVRYETITPVCTPRTRGGIMAKCPEAQVSGVSNVRTASLHPGREGGGTIS